MADRGPGSRGSVPIALGSARTESEEGREFFQSRVALFGGWIALISASFYVAYRALEIWLGPEVGTPISPVGDPNLYHLLATTLAAVLWASMRWLGPLPLRVLEWIEAVSSFLLCTLLTLMAVGFAQVHGLIEQDPMHGLLAGLLGCSYVVFSRAIAVPSTPARTVAVSTVAILPMAIGGPYALAGIEAKVNDTVAYIDLITWSVAAVAMAAITSRVIFGLRSEIDKVRRLGQYTLETKLGEGGMGVVYRASHAMLRRPTAIKVLKPEIAGDETLRRFEREVLLTASLSHPSTIAIFDYGRTPQGLFYYAMEYLDGLNLSQLVEMDGPQPPARVAHILRQVCGALAEAHAVGLIHRDIKPANIILSERGGMPDVAKVVNFGLVKSFEPNAPHADIDATQANILVGTPLYMSPEAIRGEPLDGRSDLYALGAVGYFLLTGTPVFTGKGNVEVFAHHLHSAPEPPSARSGTHIPEDLEQVILRCLAKQPSDRYDSAKALQHAVDRCAEHSSWDADVALQWWAAFRSRQRANAAGPPSAAVPAEQTIVVDITKRAIRV